MKLTRKHNSIKSAIDTKNKSEISDKDYNTKLGDKVIDILDEYYEGLFTFSFEVTDFAITFTQDDTVIYIQPSENIIPKWEDLDSDAETLADEILSDNIPSF